MSGALFQKLNLGDLELKNRVVLAPMTRSRAGKTRIPNDIMAEYYGQRTGAGLLISEATVISIQGTGWKDSPGIYTDEQRDAWKKTTSVVHQKGGFIFLQLWHMGRQSHSSYQENNQLPVSASAVKVNEPYIHTYLGKLPHEVPRALNIEEIPGVVEQYRAGAQRALEAGFDGVEIHSANGYLIDQFLQSKTNLRTDAYGGSLENRYRLLKEVVAAVRTVWPSKRIGV